jgi:lysophospholipase L1-like esterase
MSLKAFLIASIWVAVMSFCTARVATADMQPVPVDTALKVGWCGVEHAHSYDVYTSCGSGEGSGPPPTKVGNVKQNYYMLPGMAAGDWCEVTIYARSQYGGYVFRSGPSEPSNIFQALVRDDYLSEELCEETVAGTLPGDLDGDTVVGILDWTIMSGCSLPESPRPLEPPCDLADLDGDGGVNEDFRAFQEIWIAQNGNPTLKSVLLIGDSITHGTIAPPPYEVDTPGAWANQLIADTENQLTITKKGCGATQSPDWAPDGTMQNCNFIALGDTLYMVNVIEQLPVDLMVVSLGTVDNGGFGGVTTPIDYGANILALTEGALQAGADHVLLIGPPPTSSGLPNHAMHMTNLAAYNNQLLTICANHIAVTCALDLLTMLDPAVDLGNDDVHPTQSGQDKMFQYNKAQIFSVLGL